MQPCGCCRLKACGAGFEWLVNGAVWCNSIERMTHRLLGSAARSLPHQGHQGHQGATPARSSIACSSTLQPAVMCSGKALSISLWLMPSLQGMKIMPAGASRAM